MGPIFLLPLCLTEASRHHIFPHLGEGGTFLCSNRQVSSSSLALYLAEAGRHHISLFFLISFFSFFILSFFLLLLSEDASFARPSATFLKKSFHIHLVPWFLCFVAWFLWLPPPECLALEARAAYVHGFLGTITIGGAVLGRLPLPLPGHCTNS